MYLYMIHKRKNRTKVLRSEAINSKNIEGKVLDIGLCSYCLNMPSNIHITEAKVYKCNSIKLKFIHNTGGKTAHRLVKNIYKSHI